MCLSYSEQLLLVGISPLSKLSGTIYLQISPRQESMQLLIWNNELLVLVSILGRILGDAILQDGSN